MSQLQKVCDLFLDEAMEWNDLPGLVIGVSRRGEEFTGARGVRDILTKDPLQADDVFHCASVSKLFTSSAVLLLAQAGVLDLNDRLRDVLPELFEPAGTGAEPAGAKTELGAEPAGLCIADRRWEGVRLWQMLSHTAGIGDVRDYRWEECLHAEDALGNYVHSEEVTGQPLLWEPGEGGFRYSNIAYEILGHIVERKSEEYAGMHLSYEAFVHRYLMEPAGMADSSMLTWERVHRSGATDQDAPGEAALRQNAPGEAATDQDAPEKEELLCDAIRKRNAGICESWRPMALPHEKAPDRSIVPVKFYPYTRAHGPSSTLTSTAHDLLQWARVHMDGFAETADSAVRVEPAGSVCAVSGAPVSAGGLLSAETYRRIRREYAEVPNNREKMGLGWFMRRQNGCQLYGHEGTDDGFRASLWICPEKETAIAVLSNLSGAPVKKLNKKLFDLLATELD